MRVLENKIAERYSVERFKEKSPVADCSRAYIEMIR